MTIEGYMSIKNRIAKSAVALTVAGVSVLGMSGTASASSNAPWLGYGYTTSGSGVWCVQHNLNYLIKEEQGDWDSWGISSPPYGVIAEDGVWGNQTYQTVKWLQSWLAPDQIDGIVGPNTGSVLISNGDPYYVGSYGNSSHGYCWDHLPGDFL